jgi:hypothetical protein
MMWARTAVLLALAANTVVIAERSPTVATLAGTGGQGYSGDGGAALSATLGGPKGLAYGKDDVLYIADTENHVVRG